MADSAAQRKIFIGGLSYGTDDEKLKKYFGTYGQVQDAVVMKDPVSRRSRGFGFITFCDIDSVDNALAHEPHTIDARKVEAKRAVPRSEAKETTAVTVAPAKTSSETTNPKTKTTSTNSTNNSNSSTATSSAAVPPTVASAKVSSNSNSNSNSTNKRTTSTGTTISSPSSSTTTTAAATTTTTNQASVANQQPTSTTQAMIQDVSRHATDPRINMDEYAYNKVFVGGLHYDTRDAEFRSYFEKYGKVLTAEVMFNRETHKSRGFGFIVFELEEGAEGVCAEKEHIIDGKVVEVKRAIPRNKLSTTTGTNGTTTTTSQTGKGVANATKSTDIKRSASAGNVPASKNTTSAPKAASTTKTKGATVTRSPATSYAAALKAGVGNEESQLDQVLEDEDVSRPPRSQSEPIVPLPASLSFDFMKVPNAPPTELADISRNTSLSFDQTSNGGGPLLPPAPQTQPQFSSSGALGSNSTDSMMALGSNSNPTPNAWMTAPPPSVLGNSVSQRNNTQGVEGSVQNNSLGSSLGWLSSPLSAPIGAPTNLDQGIHSQGSLDSFQQLPMTHIEMNNGAGYNNELQYHQQQQQQQQQYQYQQQQRGLNPFPQQQMQYAGGRMQQANMRYNPNYQGY